MSQILDELEEIVYVCDLENYDLLYLNNAGLNLVGLKKFKPGCKCYEIIKNRKEPCPGCQNSKLSLSKTVTRTSYNLDTNKTFFVKDKLIQWDDGKIRKMSVAIDVTDSVSKQKELEETEKVESIIIKCLRLLHEKGDFNSNLNILLGEVGRYLQATRAYIFKCDYETQLAENTHKWESIQNKKTKLPINNINFTNCPNWLKKLENEEYLYIEDKNTIPAKQPEFSFMENFQYSRLFIAPILTDQKKLYGFIGVDDPSKVTNEKHLDLLFKSLAFFISTLVEQNRSSEQLQFLSYHDTLTGLQNRNKYNKDIAAYNKSKLKETGIAFVDMNGLKRTNDTYGHLAGDKCLIQIAEKLQETFPSQFIYRIGGDEFVIIVTGIGEEDFIKGINSLQDFSAEEKTPYIAIGYKWFKQITNISKILRTVDTLMYEDKNKFYNHYRATQSLQKQ